MTVDPSAYKSPVIAQAITQIIEAWFVEQHATSSAMVTGPVDAKDIDGEFDLERLGQHVAAKLGF